MKRISFMFLIKDKIQNEELWNIFFHNIPPDLYKIYIHYKIDVKLKYFEKYKLKNCILTEWGDRSLVDAQNLLIENSLKDNNITHCILLSDTCIPVKNFNYIYDLLDNNFSYFERKSPDLKQLKKHVYRFLNVGEIKKSSQWCILNRKHAKFLHNKEHIIKYFEDNNYPDERVYITALDKYGFSNEIINLPVTYCKWDYKSPHPRDFKIIKEKFLYDLVKSEHLFARKFTNCFIKNRKQIINIYDCENYTNCIKSNYKKIKNLDKLNLMKDIGFDGNSKKYNDIIKKNGGDIFHSIQDILENEHERYKKIYSFKDY